jgi:hypothetical protein
LKACAPNHPYLSEKHFTFLPPPLFVLFELIDFFQEKSPNQVQQALDSGFLLPFKVSEVPCINKKPELRK